MRQERNEVIWDNGYGERMKEWLWVEGTCWRKGSKLIGQEMNIYSLVWLIIFMVEWVLFCLTVCLTGEVIHNMLHWVSDCLFHSMTKRTSEWMPVSLSVWLFDWLREWLSSFVCFLISFISFFCFFFCLFVNFLGFLFDCLFICMFCSKFVGL